MSKILPQILAITAHLNSASNWNYFIYEQTIIQPLYPLSLYKWCTRNATRSLPPDTQHTLFNTTGSLCTSFHYPWYTMHLHLLPPIQFATPCITPHKSIY